MCAYLLGDIEQPAQHFLVGQAVEGPRKPVQAGGEGEVGVRERAANQVRGVRALGLDVAQGLRWSESYYWDLNDRTRAWNDRVKSKTPNGVWPNMTQAGDYAATLHYLKTGETQFRGHSLTDLQRRAAPQLKIMHGGSGTDGGFLLMPEVDQGPIEKLLRETVPMRQIATVKTISAYTFKTHVRTSTGGAAGFLSSSGWRAVPLGPRDRLENVWEDLGRSSARSPSAARSVGVPEAVTR